MTFIVTDTGFESPCHLWQKWITPGGYGRDYGADGRLTYAHRIAYERERGPIPEGLEIDHVCEQRACVNVSHLEAVTKRENCRRQYDRTPLPPIETVLADAKRARARVAALRNRLEALREN
jgi:hypothetical protein